MGGRVTSVARELAKTGAIKDAGRKQLLETRGAVVADWMQTAEILDRQGEAALAEKVRAFVSSMPPVMTDREKIALGLLRGQSTKQPRFREIEGIEKPREDPSTR